MPTSNINKSSASLAAQTVLALDGNDLNLFASLIDRATRQPGGAVAFIAELSSIAIECAKHVYGDNWRQFMNLALLDVSLGPHQKSRD